MEIIRVENINQADPGSLEKAADVLGRGGLLILPTSTIYGLSCRFDDRQAVKKLYRLKKRSTAMPLIILFSNHKQLAALARQPGKKAVKLMQYFWYRENPRPLTLIMPKNPGLAPFVTAGRDSIALRFAPPGFLARLIEKKGPITSTSATISGTKACPDSIENIPESIKEGVDLIVESKEKLPGIESSIADISGPSPIMIREGIIKYEHVVNIWDRA
ncbi:MAG: L-threonylcarbamoyladenylate synthase [Actinomycetota bacterium]